MVYRHALIAALAVAGLTVSAHAALISSFEQSGGPGGSVYSSTTGVTDGSWSLEVSAPTAYTQTTIFSSGEAGVTLRNNPILSLDITVLGESPSDWFEYRFGIQGDGSNGFDGLQYSAWVDHSPGASGFSTTYTWDTTGLLANMAANPAWFNFVLVTQGGLQRTVYIDNLQANPASVPEPASLGLLGVAALGLLVKRR